MEITAYRALVAELEAVARRDPAALRRQVYGLIALGYGYVLAVLLALVGTTVALVAFMVWTQRVIALWKLVAALIIVSGIIVRALWVRIEPPTGRVLRREEAPRLHERVEAIRSALRAPRPGAILLDDAFNASVSSVPRLGIFGWPRTYLTVGLPLMYALPPAQFDAVLAHEFGHLSGAHPKHGLWVHRVGRTWQQLMDAMAQKKSAGSALFERFFAWFIPRLNAYGYVMSRADEYAADADAARVTSAPAIGGALVALEVRGQALSDDFWRGIWARAEREAEPPREAWRTFPTGIRGADTHEARPARVASALQAEVGDVDTHPPLRDRLRALGLLPADPDAAITAADALLTPLDDSAAAHYLGALAEQELATLDAHWRERATKDWRTQFQQAEERRQRIAALTAKDAAGGLDAAELAELMWQVSADQGDAAAVPLAHRILAADEARPEAHYLLGRALLAAGDAGGVAHLRRAMELDPEAIMPGARLLYAFHQERQETAAMAEMEARFNARRDALEEARAERNEVRDGDMFEAPGLDAATEQAIRDGMRRTPGVVRVLVARKRTKHDPDRPMLVLLPFVAWHRWFRDDADRNVAQELLDRITAPAMPDLLVLNPRQKRHGTLSADLRRDGLAVELRP